MGRPPRRVTWCLSAAVAVAAVAAAPAFAGHVTADPSAGARLGPRLGDRSWIVIVDWAIACTGPAPGQASYTGNLRLEDPTTGETIYLGGTSSAAGTDRTPVARRPEPRALRPRITASCFDLLHGSGTSSVAGDTVLVPALGDEDGDGVVDPPAGGGGQGGRDFPGRDFGEPDDPLRRGGCVVVLTGTGRADVLGGGRRGEAIRGLGGDDRIRGNGGDDCLVGGPGRDLVVGGPGDDRLTGGPGGDRLEGGRGRNRHDAGAGDDVVLAANGRAELVSCGTGRDTARVDAADRVRGCETVVVARRGS